MAFDQTRRAGGYAQARYERGLRSWHSRNRRLLAVCFGPSVLGGLLGLAIARHPAAWACGAMFGVGLAAWIVIRESPPEYIGNWQLGAEGERKTAKALARLDDGRWFVAHDVQCARGNYDHVLVGRAGMFLIETKSPRGIVEVRDGKLWLRRRHDAQLDRPFPWARSAALASAASLSAQVERHSGRRLWVQAVVVLWADFDEGVYEDDRCAFVHGSRLFEWVRGRPDRLDGSVVEEIASIIPALGADSKAPVG